MTIDELALFRLQLPMRVPHRAAHGTVGDRALVIARMRSGDLVGWGEASPVPGYSPESADETWEALTRLGEEGCGLPAAARAALMAARLDLGAQEAGVPLWQHLGGSAAPVLAGTVVGLGDEAAVLAAVDTALATGYRHVKLKVNPDVLAVVEEARRAHPGLSLGADGNGSFPPGSIDPGWWDDLGLAYLEQPYPVGAEAETATLAEELDTPVCLDESVPLLRHWEAVGCDAASINAPSAGGLDRAVATTRAAAAAGVSLRCGGMLEAAVGRGAAMALATLPAFTLPGDLSPSTRYLMSDVAVSHWRLTDGFLIPPQAAGLGVLVDEERLRAAAAASFVLTEPALQVLRRQSLAFPT